MGRQCSFCTKRAMTMVSDDNDIFDCCADCETAWRENPGFTDHKPNECQVCAKVFSVTLTGRRVKDCPCPQ